MTSARLAAGILFLGLGATGPRAADAGELSLEEWFRLRDRAPAAFSAPGGFAEKEAVSRLLWKDGDERSWRMLRQGFEREAAHVDALVARGRAVWEELVPAWTVVRPSAAASRRVLGLVRAVDGAEADVARERALLDAMADAFAAAPAAAWKPLLLRAGGADPAATSPTFRGAVARIAGGRATDAAAHAPLRRLLESDEDPRVRLAALRAVAAGRDPPASLLTGRLADRDWGVRVAAMREIGRRRLRSAVPALIRALLQERPRGVQACLEALRAASGQDLGDEPEAWAKWWRRDDRPGAPARAPARHLTFYGIPLRSDRVVFVIDTSGSMLDPGAPAADGGRRRRIDVARTELRAALRSMPPTTRFDVVGFGSAVRAWRPEPAEAAPLVVDEAVGWVDELVVRGNTCLAGALRRAFRMARMAPLEAAESPIDTIVVLSDGRPTLFAVGDAPYQDPEELLAWVRAWNADGRIQIHAVDVGKGDGSAFMRRLAEENGGLFAKR